jgi:dihydrofolate reductase
MRKLIATVFNYSLDGLLADEGTEFWKFCFDLPENREPDDPAQLDFLQSAYAHIMGRTAYEGIAGSMTNGHRPSFRRHPERRAQGRLLPDPEDGRVGQHHHRRW